MWGLKHCVQHIKDTKWKEITTSLNYTYPLRYCVQHIKDTKWKEITTGCSSNSKDRNCVQHIKDTKWKEITTHRHVFKITAELCSTYQRYKMKGNHNTKLRKDKHPTIVFNISKIQNERKSQLIHIRIVFRAIVFNISKIQNERKSQRVNNLI